MKTKVLPLIAALLFSQVMFAQFHIGLKGGANIIKIDGKSFKDEFRFGYHLGGFMEIGLKNKWSVNPEVIFNQYSTRVDSNFKNIYLDVFKQGNVKLNYLSIPIVLNYKLFGPISLQAGPQFGILLDKNKTLLQNGTQAFKNGDFSMVAGAQVKLAALRVTGRYVVGLSNINDLPDQNKWKAQGIQLSLGLAL